MAIHVMRIERVGYTLTFATSILCCQQLECKTTQQVDLLACIAHGISAVHPSMRD